MATTRKTRSSNRLTSRRGALTGAARLMDVGGSLTILNRRSAVRPTAESSLASDWKRVGESLRSAIQGFKATVKRGSV